MDGARHGRIGTNARRAACGARIRRLLHGRVCRNVTRCMVAMAVGTPAFATSPPLPNVSRQVEMGDGSRVAILIGIAVFLMVSWMIVIMTLRRQTWNLGLALSEEAKLPEGAPPPVAGQLPPMVPSVSRLIALMGLTLFSAFFIGIGIYVIWALCNHQPLDDASKAWTLFASGAAMFLPYTVNKFADALK